jgi:hypothetical protein
MLAANSFVPELSGCAARSDDEPEANVILPPCSGMNDEEWMLENEHTK